jgi:hypothetical protein
MLPLNSGIPSQLKELEATKDQQVRTAISASERRRYTSSNNTQHLNQVCITFLRLVAWPNLIDQPASITCNSGTTLAHEIGLGGLTKLPNVTIVCYY